MKRIDSFFKKSNTPKKNKQHNDKEVKEHKEDKQQPSNSKPKNPSSAECTIDSSSNLATVARHFHPEWKETFPWVYYADGKIFCHTCLECSKKSNDSSSFVSGCSNFKIKSFKSYARSTGHIQAQEAIFAKERPTEAPLPRALLLVTKEVRQKLKKLFDVAYMVAKLELPFTVDPSLCSLEKEHAVLLVEYSIHFWFVNLVILLFSEPTQSQVNVATPACAQNNSVQG